MYLSWILLLLLQLYSIDKRLPGCCVYIVTSHSSRGLDDVNKVFAVTAETGIVYVSQPERLAELQGNNVTISVIVVINSSRDDDRESESLPSRWLSVANISVHVQHVETVSNVTSSTERKHLSFYYYYYYYYYYYLLLLLQ